MAVAVAAWRAADKDDTDAIAKAVWMRDKMRAPVADA